MQRSLMPTARGIPALGFAVFAAQRTPTARKVRHAAWRFGRHYDAY
jgi:hypothetical protein